MFAEDRFFRNKPIYQNDKFENETSFEKKLMLTILILKEIVISVEAFWIFLHHS